MLLNDYLKKQKVYIYIDHFEEYSIEKIWNDQKYNPGIGGTEFIQLRLILELNDKYSNLLEIVALTDNDNDYMFSNGVKTLSVKNALKNYDNSENILIINSGGCEKHFLLLERSKFKKKIVWIHHPLDKPKCKLAKKLRAEVVSCGLFQYFSNKIYVGRHSHINNYFYEDGIISASREKCLDQNLTKKSKNQLNIGFLGNLRESKGFHILAEYWNDISSKLINLGYNPKLIVIGGQINPTSGSLSSKLKVEKEYEQKILKSFKNNMKIPNNVYFTGVVKNPYSYASMLDLCIVSPLGIGEAASQTILELYSLSIPVITSTKYGMCDYTDQIGEIGVSKKNKLSQKILYWFNLSEPEKNKILKKQLLLAHSYSQCNLYTSAKWLSLILDDSKNFIRFSPLPKLKSLLQIPLEFYIDRKYRIKRFLKMQKK
tara:strand:- start:9232 stop:10518 length:1287 start_codon:yes stop_codon:yes gene_type:complete